MNKNHLKTLNFSISSFLTKGFDKNKKIWAFVKLRKT